ncbi:MAG: hypothetical protein HYR56_05935 [Acidobacteria bacterium]|nr:hypothetical protein [Acidobacteriota bacterium]MBI3424700.1 hypothetical protein [Acidobacteriota bacterium]
MRSAPPELAASEMTRLAANRIKNDRDWQVEVLAEAFVLARQAQLPYKLTQPGTNESLSAITFNKTIAELGMDRLSLQCTVIQALLEIDPARALALMREMDALELPITKCEEAAAPNVDVFYQMLMAVAKRSFNARQQERGEDLAFLESYLRQVNHPAQVAPAARLIRLFGTTPERSERLLDVFLTALDDVRQDDRAFSTGGTLVSVAELQTLGIFCTQYTKRGPEVFARVRRYLLEHLNGPRCADNALTANGKPAPLPEAIRNFNQLIALDEYKIEEITADEVKPSSLGGKAQATRHWQMPKAAKLRQQIWDITTGRFMSRIGYNGPPKEVRVIQRPALNTPEQIQAFQEFFEELAHWEQEENVSASDFHHQKLLLYDEAFRWLPPGPLLNQVLQDYLNLLSASRRPFNTFPEWYAHFKMLTGGYVMNDNRGAVEAALTIVNNSDDPLIQLILRVSKAPAEK